MAKIETIKEVKHKGGITEKILKNGDKVFYLRFKYLNKTYPLKNMTKLYACKSVSSVREKLAEIKLELSRGLDPFNAKGKTLNDIFYERKDMLIKNNKWQESTAKNQILFYEYYLKEKLGNFKLDKITYSHLIDIRNNMNCKNGRRNMLKLQLSPIFEDAIKRNEIYKNPAKSLDTLPTERKEKVSLRTFDNSLEIFNKLYKAVLDFKTYKNKDGKYNEFFKFLMLTGHRYGEVIQLRKEDCFIERNMIISPNNITKTKEQYEFPIPPLCLDYIKSIESGLLFPNITYSTIRVMFSKILIGSAEHPVWKYKLNQGSGVNLKNGKHLTPHDLRSIIMNIMIRDCKIDVMLADYCLEHKARGVLSHYLDYEYQDKVMAFQKFWEITDI